jgi:hypothetical protein
MTYLKQYNTLLPDGGPRYAEAAEEVQKQMLNEEDGFPTDPMDFYKRLYNATSGPFASLADDVLRDEAY